MQSTRYRRITQTMLALCMMLAWQLTRAGDPAGSAVVAVTGPPSRPAVDSPELAALGGFAVGVRTITLIDHDAIDVRRVTDGGGTVPHYDRSLTVDLWYPASASPGARPEKYAASLAGEDGKPVPFELPGIASRDARPAPGHFPLVVVSHGLGNVTVAMSWLTENLASKGYVVAAIRHQDAYGDPTAFPEVLLRRPLDIALVARSLQGSLAAEGLVDPKRTALVGYSMGGYGVLTAAGAMLDPKGAACTMVPGGALVPYARGGALAETIRVANLKAAVAISPAGGSLAAWGATGLSGITVPLLLIAGDHDRTIDYASGARAFFDAAVNSQRYLLTFKGGGHALGLGPAPPEMRQRLWDLDWFEDPVWRKERIVGINLHMITAFLDRYVKDDESRAMYLDTLQPDSSSGNWTPPAGTPWSAFSPGTDGITVWKGFQRRHAEGLEFVRASAATPGH